MTGASGQVVTVVQAGLSVKSLRDDSKDLLAVRQVLGASFKDLYSPELTYKPIEGYRDAIKVTLDGATRRAPLKARHQERQPAGQLQDQEDRQQWGIVGARERTERKGTNGRESRGTNGRQSDATNGHECRDASADRMVGTEH